MKTPDRGTSLLWLDLWCPTSLLRGFKVLLALDMWIPSVDGEVLVTGGAEDIDGGVFEFGSMSAPPKVGFIGISVLAGHPAALAEFDHMVLSTIGVLTDPCSQQRWAGLYHCTVGVWRSVAGTFKGNGSCHVS